LKYQARTNGVFHRTSLGKPLFLIVVQIPRILQQQPRSLQIHPLFGSELAPENAAGCIHSLIQMLDDVVSANRICALTA